MGEEQKSTAVERAAPGQLTREDKEMLGIDRWLSPEGLRAKLDHVQLIIGTVLIEDVHYGTLPGTEKPMLYQTGAQALNMAFDLRAESIATPHDLPGEHREFIVKTVMINKKTGMIMGEGQGSCSTMESKYRYRNADPLPTEREVPEGFWKARTQMRYQEMEDILGGKDFTFRKIDGKWMVCKKTGEKVPNENPADFYNTVLKIATKRARKPPGRSTPRVQGLFSWRRRKTLKVRKRKRLAHPAKKTGRRLRLRGRPLRRHAPAPRSSRRNPP